MSDLVISGQIRLNCGGPKYDISSHHFLLHPCKFEIFHFIFLIYEKMPFKSYLLHEKAFTLRNSKIIFYMKNTFKLHNLEVKNNF